MNNEKINNTVVSTYKTKTHNVKVNSIFHSDKRLLDALYSIATLRLKELKEYDNIQHREI